MSARRWLSLTRRVPSDTHLNQDWEKLPTRLLVPSICSTAIQRSSNSTARPTRYYQRGNECKLALTLSLCGPYPAFTYASQSPAGSSIPSAECRPTPAETLGGSQRCPLDIVNAKLDLSINQYSPE